MISLPIFAGLLKFISVYINESLAEFVHKWNESVKHKIKIDLRSIKVRFRSELPFQIINNFR